MTMKELDEEWFSTRLEENVTSIKWDDVDCEGYIASVKRVHLQLASGEERVVIVKILGHGYKSDTAPFAKQIGSAREADFFNHIRSLPDKHRAVLRNILSAVFFAESDWQTGDKIILMEDLSSVGITSSLYLDSRIILNKGKDVAKLTARCPNVELSAIARESIICIARVHALFWDSKDFPLMPWLRGHEWPQRKGQLEWESAAERAKTGRSMFVS